MQGNYIRPPLWEEVVLGCLAERTLEHELKGNILTVSTGGM